MSLFKIYKKKKKKNGKKNKILIKETKIEKKEGKT